MKILIDAMGGDNAPLCMLQGAQDAMQEFGDGMEITLLGNAEAIQKAAAENAISLDGFSVLNCTENVEMCDDPVKVVRHKPDSSMIKGLTMLKNGEGDAFVSAGSTGALHVGTSLIVKTVKGVKRPALATCMPGSKKGYLLLDCGANVECRATTLNAFGTIGSVYAQKVIGLDRPDVALINNGAEESKGTPIYREAYGLLKNNPSIHFIGNIEPRDVPAGNADVVVCDGFVGNVVLKLSEGMAKMILGMLKGIFLENLITKLSFLGVKKGMKALKKNMDSEETGGAPLLGAAKPVIKAHGSSSRKGIKNAIRQAKKCVESDVCGTMQQALDAAMPATEAENHTNMAE
jgi:glycerol-3-phosphate acyltransferase PlsX